MAFNYQKIAIDEYKADTDEGKYQLMVANEETHEPIDILPNRRKETIHHYLSEYGSNVKMVVMDNGIQWKKKILRLLKQGY